MKQFFWVCGLVMVMCSCAVQKDYSPVKKFSPQQLQEDFTIFQGVLEESHPSLYWYTSRDSMDLYFNTAKNRLSDSLTETRFRYLLSYVTSKIRCGHTSVMASRPALRYAQSARNIAFPLSVKAWPDTVVITANLNRKDSLVKRGMVLHAIEGRPINTIIDSIFNHLSTDGYNTTHKYQVLSNGGNFRNFYSALYGLRNRMTVEVSDSTGQIRSAQLSLYNPEADTPARRQPVRNLTKKERKKLELEAERNIRIDTALNTAFMEVNSFAKGRKLRSFFRSSFKNIKKRGIKNLVIDVRGNGGGSVVLSNLLTKYIADKPFKIADSLYAPRRTSKYKKYRSQYFLNQLFFWFMTNRDKQGRYHFDVYEGKYFKPKKSNHFEGNTYILTGGNTFSAASLFTKALVSQDNVTVVGEETGGGGYGNSAWLIPEVTLPNTGVRFRLPLFRLVIDKEAPKGTGILPEVEARPTVNDIRRSADFKMEKVIELIKNRQ
jgi:hypothetical protein